MIRGARADADTAVSVIVEVKGCWHPELGTAIESQLAERYLKNNECQHGLYLVGWFSPEEYGNPSTLDELLATSDVALYDLVNDPGELRNLAHPDHPGRDAALIERMLAKLHALVAREIGEDRCPFDLDMFGTREVRYRKRNEAGSRGIEKRRPRKPRKAEAVQ